MTAPVIERRATEVAALHAEGVEGLDRSIASLKAAIAANERLLRRPQPVAWDVIERHPAQVKREWPAWAERALDWALALAIGIGLGWAAAQGF